MKKALVTGASSGIGREICNRLLTLGYSVIGISRSVSDKTFDHKHFKAINVDLTNQKDTLKLCSELKKESIYMVIHSAGFGRFEPHEEMSAKTIIDMTFLNLTAPMLLTNATLRSLKQNDGYVININSIEALRASKFAALYSATKSGLKAFGDSLFEESRRSDLSVININPDMTETNFYDSLRFNVTSKDDEKLLATDIADAIEHIVTMRKGVVVTNYTIRSTRFGIRKESVKNSVSI